MTTWTAPRLRQVTPILGGRYYEAPDGTRYPSVTSILGIINKPALMHWAASEERKLVSETAAALYEDLPLDAKHMSKMAYLETLSSRLGKMKAHHKASQKALDIGSGAHARIEWWLRGELGQVRGSEPIVPTGSLWAAMAFEDWWREANLKPIALEQMVWNEQDGYAGTMDLLATDAQGVLCLGDVKTSKAVYAEYKLQLAAYAKAIETMEHGTVRRAFIIRLPKNETDPAFEVVEVEDIYEHYASFLHAKGLWEWQQKQEAKR